jgi:hypothetical protein
VQKIAQNLAQSTFCRISNKTFFLPKVQKVSKLTLKDIRPIWSPCCQFIFDGAKQLHSHNLRGREGGRGRGRETGFLHPPHVYQSYLKTMKTVVVVVLDGNASQINVFLSQKDDWQRNNCLLLFKGVRTYG